MASYEYKPLSAQLPVVSGGVVAAAAVVPAPFPLFVPKGARLVARQKGTSTSGTVGVAAICTYLR